ncbi:MAG: alpha/beta hydrolase [Candidatus Thermoplasmatota archaeon]|nr:alpha/beta hydrolase [Candidatus Thermoplasmatota archaeon]
MSTEIEYTEDGIAYKRIEDHPGRPTIIFLHDSLGCIETWGDFPERLGELSECNVLIYDRPGYGRSRPMDERDKDYLEVQADLLCELMEVWGIDDAVLYGHSDGGSIALITGSKYPSKISGILTEGAHVFVEDVAVDGVKDTAELYRTTELKSKLKRYHGDKTEEMFRAWAETWTAEWFRDWDIEDHLPSINCPVLVIQGGEDGYGTITQVEKIVEGTSGPSSRLIVPGAGHTPHEETQDIVLETSSKFMIRVTDD